MMKRYKKKDVELMVLRIKEEYEQAVKAQREAQEELKEENRLLRARLSVLEGQKSEVSAALTRAIAEGEKIKQESAAEADSEKKELKLLAEKCRLLSERLTQMYPDVEDVKEFETFTDALREKLGEKPEEEEEEECGFNMDDVLNPKEPLDLGNLCRELGLMEESDE